MPDTPEQSTSDHGWDFAADGEMLLPIAEEFRAAGIRVSYFVDATPGDPALAQQAGADRIEFYTGPFAGQTSRRPPPANSTGSAKPLMRRVRLAPRAAAA